MEHATCHLYFLRIHTRLKARVYTENASDVWHVPRYPTRKHCITSIYYTILYYTILYYTILYYTILYYTTLHYTILYYTILYYTILYYTILYYTIPYFTILYYAMLCYTILYYGIAPSYYITPNYSIYTHNTVPCLHCSTMKNHTMLNHIIPHHITVY